MANLLITLRCNRKCPFCFARGRVSGKPQPQDGSHMSRASIRKVMTLLARTGDKNLRLLGGEPTQHPEFREIVDEALGKDLHVHVFTNGIMSKKTADFLGEIPRDRLSVLCNISPQAKDSQRQEERRRYALRRLGERARLGITITSPEFEFEYLIRSIKELGSCKRIRVGIAQPIVGTNNEFLEPSDYRQAGRSIMRMARMCVKEDVLLGFDCGLTLCMFSERELGTLMTCTEKFNSVCGPVIDIGPNLEIWHCFPLSEVLNTDLHRFESRGEIVAYYEKLVQPYRSLGCMPECLRCDYLRRRQCTGGCLAHAMNAMNRPPPRDAEAIGA